MEARGPFRFTVRALFVVFVFAGTTKAATFRTPNFIVNAHSPEFAKRVGTAAEQFRKELSVMWTGQEMKNWSAPCPINVKVGQIGAGGATTFSFHNGEVFGWKMNIQGSEERILDSVLPHEITHTILACRFRRPLPRWADEGVCTLVEHESERRRQTLLLGDVMRSGRRIPLKSLFSMTEYPSDMREILKLYAQGYSLVDYLVQQGGRETFMRFLHDALRHGSWDQALGTHYGVNTIAKLEQKWGKWVLAGSPTLNLPKGDKLALNEQPQRETVVRGQSPDTPNLAAPHPVAEQQMAHHDEPNRPNQNRTEADAIPFNAGNQIAATNPKKNSTGSMLNHQASRSRNSLVSPVYTWPVRQSQATSRKQRGQLQSTGDSFHSPKTPLTNRDSAHPFTGGTRKDIFSP